MCSSQQCICARAGSNAFVCVGTFNPADKKVSDPPAEYAAASAQDEAGGKGKGKAAARDSGKGKVGGLAAAAPPRCPIFSVTCFALLLLVLRLVCTLPVI